MARIRKIVALVALALGACGEGPTTQPAPLDRFTFPTGLALHTLGDGTRALIVVSSNFDLRFDSEDGGSVMVVDPDASVGDALAVRSAVRISSFGGPPAVVSNRDDPTTPEVDPVCAEWPGSDEVLVASRAANGVYRMGLADDGTLTCDECLQKLDPDVPDPYAISVACFRSSFGVPFAQAFVTHLAAPDSGGWLTRFDLLSPDGFRDRIPLSTSPTQDLAWDPARRRLYVTSRFAVIGSSPFRWLDLAFQPALTEQADLNAFLRGADARGIALANPEPGTSFARRAYIAARVFDQDLALALGGRTPDVAGALMVVDISDDANGRPRAQVTRIVPVGIGASQVAVLPGRPPGQEIVAVTSDEGSIALYDETRGAVVRVLATASADTVAPGPFQPLDSPGAAPGPRDPAAYRTGEKLFGDQPFAVVSEQLPNGRIRLFVSSFDRGFVAEVQLDTALPSAAQVTKRFGRRHP